MKGVSAGSAATTSADRNTLTPAFYLGSNPYSIVSQESTVASRTGSGGQLPFTINTATGVISVNGAVNLDFEIKSSYKVVVQVIDNGGLKANATFTILLTNANDAPFWLSVPTLNAIQIDTQTLSPALGPFAQDQDFDAAGSTEQLSYSIDSGNGESIFAIDSFKYTINHDKSYDLDLKGSLDRKIQQYADTLNNLHIDAPLPEFLINHFEDIEFSVVLGFHDGDTFRQLLFKRIINKVTLQKILQSKEKSIDKIYYHTVANTSYSLPYSTFTVRQLAKKRLKELKK
jgi:hypothetical protein